MATLATNVSFQCFGLDGKPLAGGKVYTYSAGTTTSKATYTTMAGTVANPNPVILDQNGKAKIFLGDGSYRLQIKDSNDALIDDIDQISRYVTQSEFAAFQQTVNDGVSQLTEVREQIDVFVSTSIGNQKGFANGITPLDANVKVDPIYLPQATEAVFGVSKIATTAIAQVGTDDTDFLTAKKLRDALNATGDLPIACFRSHGHIKTSGATVTLAKQLNVASVVRVSTGVYTVTFSKPMPDTDYLILHGLEGDGGQDFIKISPKASKTVNGFNITLFTATGPVDGTNFSFGVIT